MEQARPVLVVATSGRWRGRPVYRWPDGTVVPRISGGSGGGDDAGTGGGGGGGGASERGEGGDDAGTGGGGGREGRGREDERRRTRSEEGDRRRTRRSDDDDDEGDGRLSAEEMRVELSRARKEAAGYRQRAKDAESRAKKYEEDEEQRRQAELSKIDQAEERAKKAEARAVELERTLAQRDFRDRATDVAKDLNFRSPSIAWRLVDEDKVRTKAGELDEGELEDLLREELRRHPELGTGGGADGGQGRESTKADSMNDLIRGGARARRGA